MTLPVDLIKPVELYLPYVHRTVDLQHEMTFVWPDPCLLARLSGSLRQQASSLPRPETPPESSGPSPAVATDSGEMLADAAPCFHRSSAPNVWDSREFGYPTPDPVRRKLRAFTCRRRVKKTDPLTSPEF